MALLSDKWTSKRRQRRRLCWNVQTTPCVGGADECTVHACMCVCFAGAQLPHQRVKQRLTDSHRATPV